MVLKLDTLKYYISYKMQARLIHCSILSPYLQMQSEFYWTDLEAGILKANAEVAVQKCVGLEV